MKYKMSYDLRPRSGAEGNLGQIGSSAQTNVFANLQFPTVQHNAFTNIQSQQAIVPFQQPQLQPTQLQPTQLEVIIKAEIQKYFQGVDVYMENDVVSRFGSYMTGIDLCVIYKEKLIAIHLKQSDTKANVKDLSHFVFCSNRIIKVNPHFRLYMISASKTQPTKNSLDLINDCKIYSVVSNDQSTFLNQLMHMIHDMLIDTSVPMDVC